MAMGWGGVRLYMCTSVARSTRLMYHRIATWRTLGSIIMRKYTYYTYNYRIILINALSASGVAVLFITTTNIKIKVSRNTLAGQHARRAGTVAHPAGMRANDAGRLRQVVQPVDLHESTVLRLRR